MSEDFRPKTFDSFISKSNEQAVKILKDATTACRITKKQLPHILLYGPAGTGKTTLAKICANEVGNCVFIDVMASTMNKPTDVLDCLAPIIIGQEENKKGILFIDEVHELGKKENIETLFYPLLEDFTMYHNLKEDWVINGAFIPRDKIELKPFTIISATTDPALLRRPLLDRFKIHATLKAYTDEDIKKVLEFNSKALKIEITEKAKTDIANRSRGTPRIAVNFLSSTNIKRIVRKEKQVTVGTVNALFKDLKIDKNGLGENDISVLKILKKHPKGIGIQTLSGIANIDKRTLSEMYLSYLQRKDLIITTHRQFITNKGLNYLKGK